MLYVMSALDAAQLSALKELEADLGCSILALTKMDIIDDAISENGLSKLQNLENALGVALVAVKQD